MNRVWAVSWIGVLLFTGCAHNSQITWKIDDHDQLKTVLREHIPPGTPVALAQRFMEKEGFTCARVSKGVFVEREQWHEEGPLHENIDYLDCNRSWTAGSIFMVRKTEVGLVLDHGVVKDVLVSSFVDGP